LVPDTQQSYDQGAEATWGRSTIRESEILEVSTSVLLHEQVKAEAIDEPRLTERMCYGNYGHVFS